MKFCKLWLHNHIVVVGYNCVKIMFLKDGMLASQTRQGRRSIKVTDKGVLPTPTLLFPLNKRVFSSAEILGSFCARETRKKERCGCLQNYKKKNEISNETTGDRSAYII